jgi:hypothetical protein
MPLARLTLGLAERPTVVYPISRKAEASVTASSGMPDARELTPWVVQVVEVKMEATAGFVHEEVE